MSNNDYVSETHLFDKFDTDPVCLSFYAAVSVGRFLEIFINSSQQLVNNAVVL